jgi:hypothetical protein
MVQGDPTMDRVHERSDEGNKIELSKLREQIP